MSLFKSKYSKSKLPNMKKIAEHSKVFCFKFTDISRQERHAGHVSESMSRLQNEKLTIEPNRMQRGSDYF
jgi:hypothetical protein